MNMYTPHVWIPRLGTNLNPHTKANETANSVDLVNAPEAVSQQGTPFSTDIMNEIESGIVDASSGVGLRVTCATAESTQIKEIDLHDYDIKDDMHIDIDFTYGNTVGTVADGAIDSSTHIVAKSKGEQIRILGKNGIFLFDEMAGGEYVGSGCHRAGECHEFVITSMATGNTASTAGVVKNKTAKYIYSVSGSTFFYAKDINGNYTDGTGSLSYFATETTESGSTIAKTATGPAVLNYSLNPVIEVMSSYAQLYDNRTLVSGSTVTYQNTILEANALTLSYNGGTAYPIKGGRGEYLGIGAWGAGELLRFRFIGTASSGYWYCENITAIMQGGDATNGYYTKYRDGKTEQHGISSAAIPSGQSTVFNLPIQMYDDTYDLQLSTSANTTSATMVTFNTLGDIYRTITAFKAGFRAPPYQEGEAAYIAWSVSS